MKILRIIPVLFLAVAAGCTATQPAAATAPPVISARLGLHWPYSRLPENSAAALDAAARAGAGKVEIDVQYSRDGVPMAIHDTTVNRTTLHTGPVGSYTAAQLGAMRLRVEGRGPASRWMSGQRMPTVRALLVRARADGMAVSAEVKPAALTYARARALLRAFWAAGDEGAVDVRSYIPGVLRQMRAAGYWGRLTLTVMGVNPDPPAGIWEESVNYANNWPGAPVVPPVPAGDVAALQARGIKADAYTLDTAAQFALAPAGIDSVTTDNVTGAVMWCRAREAGKP